MHEVYNGIVEIYVKFERNCTVYLYMVLHLCFLEKNEKVKKDNREKEKRGKTGKQ